MNPADMDDLVRRLVRQLTVRQRWALVETGAGAVSRYRRRATETVEQGEDLWSHDGRFRRLGATMRTLLRAELVQLLDTDPADGGRRRWALTELGHAVVRAYATVAATCQCQAFGRSMADSTDCPNHVPQPAREASGDL